MTSRRTELGLWIVAIASLAGGVVSLRASQHLEPQPGRIVGRIDLPVSLSPDSIEKAVSGFTEGNPFRLSRRPALVAFHPALEGMPPPPAAPVRPAKPVLSLGGILGGPPWEALIDGIPGREASVLVRSGERVGDLTVRSITENIVVISGRDTTWRLTIKRAWQ